MRLFWNVNETTKMLPQFIVQRFELRNQSSRINSSRYAAKRKFG